MVFSETQEAGLRRSLSAGATGSFVDITPPLIPDEVTQFYAPFSLDPGNSDRLLYGTNRIWEILRGKSNADLRRNERNSAAKLDRDQPGA